VHYLQWNDKIASYFFNADNAGKEVYLSVSQKLIEKLGSTDGDFRDFITALKTGPPWVRGNLLICDRALKTWDEWRQRRLPFPPYIGYLSLFVVVVPETADHSPLAYHNPLRRLLGEPAQVNRPYPRFDRMIELWNDLEVWSRQDEQGRLGLFKYSFAGNHIHVGIPREQFLAGTGAISEDATKTCPQCKEVKSIGKEFGWRKIAGKEIPQSWCYQCRSGSWKKTTGSTGGVPSQTPIQPRTTRSLRLLPRLRFMPGSTVALSLVPRRLATMPEQLDIIFADGQSFALRKIHDCWFSDVEPINLEKYLLQGAKATALTNGISHSWQASGQHLYVLSGANQISGFLAHNGKFEIGGHYTVLCTAAIKDQTEAILKEIGAKPKSVFTDADGLPSGLVCFKDIVPTKTRTSTIQGFELLSPLQKFDVQFSGGIRIESTTWLAGYPPEIQVTGVQDIQDITIDGNPAKIEGNGLRASCWDSPGKHVISYSRKCRTYEILEPDGDWSPWECHQIESPQATYQLCGASLWTRTEQGDLIPVSGLFPTNRFLLGAVPGEIYISRDPNASRNALSEKPLYVPFEPVWSLPHDPIHSNKRRETIQLLNITWPTYSPRLKLNRSVMTWARLILDGGRKGLPLCSSDNEAMHLWQAYKDIARKLRRRFNERN
jgi:hypothetical protein